MGDLLLELAPLVVAAAISPATIGIVVLILATAERPLLRAGAFLAGFAGLLVVLSVAGLLLLRGTAGGVDEDSPGFGWVDVAMGVLLLGTATFSLLRPGSIDEQQERLRGAPVPAFAGFGAVMMLTSLNTLAVAVSLLHRIATADVSAFERGLALAICDAAILLPIAVPIAICLFAPTASERVLPAIRRGVDRYGVRVGAVVFAAIGVYLIAEGLSHL